jgi:Flp pilus assembly protein TadD
MRLLKFIAFFMAWVQVAPAADGMLSAGALATRGDERATRGDIEGAVEDYGDAIKKDRHCVRAYFGRGLLRVRFGQFDAGIVDYNRVIQLKPQMKEALVARGVSLQAKGDCAKASVICLTA